MPGLRVVCSAGLYQELGRGRSICGRGRFRDSRQFGNQLTVLGRNFRDRHFGRSLGWLFRLGFRSGSFGGRFGGYLGFGGRCLSFSRSGFLRSNSFSSSLCRRYFRSRCLGWRLSLGYGIRRARSVCSSFFGWSFFGWSFFG